jgi:hypothetical protein
LLLGKEKRVMYFHTSAENEEGGRAQPYAVNSDRSFSDIRSQYNLYFNRKYKVPRGKTYESTLRVLGGVGWNTRSCCSGDMAA